MSRFYNYENIEPTYLPDNTTEKDKIINHTIDYSLPHDEYDVWGNLSGKWWVYGDTLELPIDIHKKIRVNNSDIVYLYKDEKPDSLTEAKLNTLAYNIVDIKCWKLTSISDGFYTWEETSFTYPLSGDREVKLNPDLTDKDVIFNLNNSRGENVISEIIYPIDDEYYISLDEEKSLLLKPGVYNVLIEVVKEDYKLTIQDYKLRIAKESDIIEYNEYKLPDEKDYEKIRQDVDYNYLKNIPTINGIPVIGDKSSADFNLDNSPAISKLSKYLYLIEYKQYDEEFCRDFFRRRYNSGSVEEIPSMCSTVKKDNYVGRNFDWYYDNTSYFVTRTSASLGKYATLGVAGGLPELTDDFVQSGKQHELYRVLPYATLDGVNEKGVQASILVVPTGDAGLTFGTHPELGRDKSYCTTMLPRYIIDHFDNAQNACEFIKDNLNVYSPIIKGRKSESHIFVSDKTHSYVIEFVDTDVIPEMYTEQVRLTTCTIVDITDKPYLTNFYLFKTEYFSNNHINRETVTRFGKGLERFNLIADNYESLTDKESIINFMKNDLDYIKSYDPYNGWYSEFNGLRIEEDKPKVLDNRSTVAEGVYTINRIRPYFENRSRDDVENKTWHTAFSSTYDLDKITLHIESQIDDIDSYYSNDFALSVSYSADEIDRKLNETENRLNNKIILKQDKLESGTNIKTINNESVLGAGNIDIALYDTKEKWDSFTDFIPKKGQIIVYTGYGVKIGDGNTLAIDLPFAEETLYNKLTEHISNTDIHATLEEKDFWSNKINIVSDVVNETLIFTRN